MATVTVEIKERAFRILQELAKSTGEPMQVVLDKALEEYRRKQFLEGLSADFAALRDNPELWQEELEERAAWDVTLADGLEKE